MSDLTTRLLSEIERREGNWRDELEGGYQRSTMAAYLAALRKIVELHRAKEVRVYGVGVESAIGWRTPTGPYAIELDCTACDGCLEYPCPTVTAIATALDVTP